MKKNFSIIVLIILLLATSFLFLRGNAEMEKSSEGFTMFYFENTNNKIPEENPEKILNFIIDNNKKKELEYEVTYYINNQEIFRNKINIAAKEMKQFSPPEEILSEIEKIEDNSFVYQIKTDKSKEKFELTKKVFLK